MSLIVFPAIDLKAGQVVRLAEGDMARATVYGDDPAAQALLFAEAGAEHLHVVDLDGAFAGESVNGAAVESIIAAFPGKVQVGGGIRDRAGVDRWLFSILHSVWVNELRAQHVRQGQGFVDVDDLDEPAETFTFEDRHWHTQVMQRVKRLPEAQRNAVFLVYVEGFTYQEAAMTLSVPIGTIMSRLASARLTLAKNTGMSSRQGEKK